MVTRHHIHDISHCNCDVTLHVPLSMAIALQWETLCVPMLKWMETGFSALVFISCLCAIILLLNEVLVCPTYCALHFLQVIKYIRWLLSQVNEPKMVNVSPVFVLVRAVAGGLSIFQVKHLGLPHGLLPFQVGFPVKSVLTNISLMFLGLLYAVINFVSLRYLVSGCWAKNICFSPE